METVLTAQEALPRMRAILDQGSRYKLTVTGTSMVPFLRHRKDVVLLEPWDGAVRPGEILFYLTAAGRPLLHRLHKQLADGTLVLCGDHLTCLETVHPEQVWARVCQVERNGRTIAADAPLWRWTSRLWIGLFPIRKALLILVHGLWRLKQLLLPKSAGH